MQLNGIELATTPSTPCLWEKGMLFATVGIIIIVTP